MFEENRRCRHAEENACTKARMDSRTHACPRVHTYFSTHPYTSPHSYRHELNFSENWWILLNRLKTSLNYLLLNCFVYCFKASAIWRKRKNVLIKSFTLNENYHSFIILYRKKPLIFFLALLFYFFLSIRSYTLFFIFLFGAKLIHYFIIIT